MKAKKVLSLACACAFAAATLSSCMSATTVAGISSNAPIGSKMGVSSQTTYLGCIGTGGPQQSIKAAAENGGIKTISHVEHYNKSILGGLIIKHEIRVYGE